jgi:hypothetical protein
MKKTVIAIAKASKTYDEFVDAIYALDAYVFIDDDDTVFYVADNGRTYTYDVSEYISKMA